MRPVRHCLAGLVGLIGSACVPSNVVAATGARLEVRASDPAVKVVVEGGTVTGPITMARGDFRELEVQVSASVNGLYYLSVFTTQDGRFTASSIPLKIGTGESRQKAQGSVQTTPSGEKVKRRTARS